jgi:hypothetical protein
MTSQKKKNKRYHNNIEIIYITSPDMNFADSPLQTQRLQNSGLMPPLPLTDEDVTNPDTRKLRRLSAAEYESVVKSQLKFGTAEAADLDAAKLYTSKVYAAESMPSIQRNLMPIAAADIAEAIMVRLNARFDQIDARFAQIDARHINGFAEHMVHEIAPLPRVPVIGEQVNEVPPLPDFFPQTRGGIYNLNSNQVNGILQYYGLPIDGTLEARRKRILQFLGCPPAR